MRYTIIIDDLALPKVAYVGADTLAQAKQELRVHLSTHPKSTNVVAEVGEPGVDDPKWVLVATARKGVRTLRGVTRDIDGRLVLPTTTTPELAPASA